MARCRTGALAVGAQTSARNRAHLLNCQRFARRSPQCYFKEDRTRSSREHNLHRASEPSVKNSQAQTIIQNRTHMSIPRPNGAPGAYFAALGVTNEVTRQVMAAALSKGGDNCDLYFEHASSTSVLLTDGKVNQASTQVSLGMGVRVRIGDQVGYAYSEDLSPSALKAAALTAAGIANASAPRDVATPVAMSLPNHYPVVQPWDDVDIGHRVKMVREWEQAAFARDERQGYSPTPPGGHDCPARRSTD